MLATALLLTTCLVQAEPSRGSPVQRRLQGRVLDVAGQPIAGAGFTTGRPGYALTAAALEQPVARSGADGRFELTVSVPQEDAAGTPIQVLVAAPGRASLRWPLTDLGAAAAAAGAEPVDVGDVVLPAGVAIRGQVRGEGGRPLAGARVRCADLIGIRQNLGDGQGGSARLFASYGVTKEDGSFHLPGVFPTLLEVRVDAPGYYTRSLAPVTASDPLVLELVPSGFVEGRLVDAEGKPRAGAVAAQYEAEHYIQDLATEPDGSFRFPVRFPVRFRLRAWVPGEARMGAAESEVLPGAMRGLELRLKATQTAEPKAQRLLVRAVDERGQAIPKPRACVLWLDAASFDATWVQNLFDQGLTDADPDGVVRLEGPGEDSHPTGTVRVVALGYAPVLVAEVAWKEDVDTPVEVRLKPQSVLEGTLRDPKTKAPVAAAEVRVVALPEPRSGQPVVQLGGAGNQLGRVVRTDAEGRFRIDQLGAGRHELFVRGKERPETRALELALRDAETKRGLELELARGATLTGKILGQKPASGWQVRLEPTDRGGESPFQFVLPVQPTLSGLLFPLGADGSFIAPGLARGNYQVHLLIPVDPRLGQPLCLPIEPIRIRSNDLTREFDGSEELPATVSGTLKIDGAPLDPTRLLVGVVQGRNDDAWFSGVGHAGELAVRRAPVDAAGRFQLALAPGSYQLLVVDSGTGVRLLLDGQKLDLKPGATAVRELEIKAVKVRVRLVREGPGRALGSRLQIDSGRDDRQAAAFGPRYDFGIGLDLAEGLDDLTLFVPPGPVRLVVNSQAWRLQRDQRTAENKTLGEAELDAQPGELRTVEVKLQPLPEIGEEKAEGKEGEETEKKR